jgi:predicted HAD superfamily Cof-like phosphohydrolase
MLADLLGDIQVYCASEMAKFGLPLDEVLAIIMRSNFSKLGADGKPIYDERGKVQKGPNYWKWKPEPKIKELLSGLDEVAV